jgi:hypothetical protein
MMLLHPEFAGVEQVLALFGGEGAQGGVGRVGQECQLLGEVGGEGLLDVLLQKGLPVLSP